MVTTGGRGKQALLPITCRSAVSHVTRLIDLDHYHLYFFHTKLRLRSVCETERGATIILLKQVRFLATKATNHA